MLKRVLLVTFILGAFSACTPRHRCSGHPHRSHSEADGKAAPPAGGAGVTAEADDKSSVFGTAKAIPGALKGDIYYLAEDTEKLPDLTKMTPVGSIYTRKLDIPVQDFRNGFPGVTDRFEWFAIRYTGTFTVTAAGEYGFRLGSDDGAKLFIDGKLVVDNDGVHSFQDADGKVTLTAGPHAMVLEYFQGPATEIGLQLWVTAPGAAETIWTL